MRIKYQNVSFLNLKLCLTIFTGCFFIPSTGSPITEDKIENNMNICNKKTEVSLKPELISECSQKMETDEHEPEKFKKTEENQDEKMDVEETPHIEEENIEVIVEVEISKCISRIFDATWNEHCEGSTFVKDTMSAIMDSNLDPKNYKELICEVLGDMLRQYFEGSIKLPEIEPGVYPFKKIRPNNMDVDKKEEDEEVSVRAAAIYYLINSYNRCVVEVNRYHNYKGESVAPRILEVISNCRQQILKNSINILTNKFVIFDDCKAMPHEVSPLLLAMYDPNIDYQNFVRDLMEETFVKTTKKGNFRKIFNKILEDIFMEMKNSPIKSMEALPLDPVNRIIELLDIQFEVNREVLKPICQLIVEHPAFLPTLSSDIAGREIARVSFLGPFLQISILSDENPYFPIEDYYDVSNNLLPMMQTSIQNKLDYIRSLLHKIFYAFILYKDSRDVALKYIAQLLLLNAKRVQYSADERNLARDGFMLNLMASEYFFFLVPFLLFLRPFPLLYGHLSI